MKNSPILIKGAGDLASAVALRLYNAGYSLVMSDIQKPTVVRRTVAFAEAIYTKSCIVENIEAIKTDIVNYQKILDKKAIPIFVDMTDDDVERIHPRAVIDAIIAKKNLGTYKSQKYYTIALGPGFCASKDVDIVIETKRGHSLGRCIYQGYAAANTGIPGEVMGYTLQRVLRAESAGFIEWHKKIGDFVSKEECIGILSTNNSKVPIIATISGVLRGMIHPTCPVTTGLKIGDIDPRADAVSYCDDVSDKGLSLGGAVLEALLKQKIYP